MELKFRVQNPHMTPSATRATVGGKDMTVSVEAFEVDLVSESPMNGGLKLRFIGDEVEGAKNLFQNDALVTATLAGYQEKPAA
jgi:hypothetical protein